MADPYQRDPKPWEEEDEDFEEPPASPFPARVCTHGLKTSFSETSGKLLGFFLCQCQHVKIRHGFHSIARIKPIIAACPRIAKRKIANVVAGLAMTNFLNHKFDVSRELYLRSLLLRGCADHGIDVFFHALENAASPSEICIAFVSRLQKCDTDKGLLRCMDELATCSCFHSMLPGQAEEQAGDLQTPPPCAAAKAEVADDLNRKDGNKGQSDGSSETVPLFDANLYRQMLSFKLPTSAVQQRMELDRVPSASIQEFLASGGQCGLDNDGGDAGVSTDTTEIGTEVHKEEQSSTQTQTPTPTPALAPAPTPAPQQTPPSSSPQQIPQPAGVADSDRIKLRAQQFREQQQQQQQQTAGGGPSGDAEGAAGMANMLQQQISKQGFHATADSAHADALARLQELENRMKEDETKGTAGDVGGSSAAATGRVKEANSTQVEAFESMVEELQGRSPEDCVALALEAKDMGAALVGKKEWASAEEAYRRALNVCYTLEGGEWQTCGGKEEGEKEKGTEEGGSSVASSIEGHRGETWRGELKGLELSLCLNLSLCYLKMKRPANALQQATGMS
jgi:hypothetical protein